MTTGVGIGAGFQESTRKQEIRTNANRQAPQRDRDIARHCFYYDRDAHHLASLIRPGARILDLGCGTADLLERLQPREAVGVDLSEEMVRRARERLPEAEIHLGDVEDPSLVERIDGTFDYILLCDTLAVLEDCHITLSQLHRFCDRETRLVIAEYSSLWEPILRLAEWIGAKRPQTELNWLSTGDLMELLELTGFRVVSVRRRILCPLGLFGLGHLVNGLLTRLPGVRRLCLRRYLVARSHPLRRIDPPPSLTVVIPCRNERDNVEQAVLRTPRVCEEQEIVFVEGHSTDRTWEEIQRVQAAYPEREIRAIRQPGIGKADAVWSAFDTARGEILLILDGDLTVSPEYLPQFYNALVEGHGEFLMGTRMVYPVEKTAMRFLNYWANQIFAALFSWLLEQRITDTLCGTKVIRRRHYELIKEDRRLGKTDPFGDFDLILGAAAQSLEIREIPVRYVPRAYGETQISRFRHGLMLAKLFLRACRQR